MSGAYLFAALPTVPVWLALRHWSVLAGTARVAAAYAVGTGASATAFIAARAAGLPTLLYFWMEALLCVAIAAALCARGRGAAAWPRFHGKQQPLPLLWLSATAIVMAGVGVGVVTQYYMRGHPYGNSDAWAIWNVRAAFLAAEGQSWTAGFSEGSSLSHQDYPLLLPAAIARLWSLAGNGPEPAGYFAASVLVATAMLLASATSERLGAPGLLVGLGLLLTPEFVRQGTTQCADLLVGLYSVLAVILLSRANRSSATTVLAGVSCGCAAWTKNEGLVVAIVLPLIAIFMAWRDRGRSEATNVAADLSIGLFPFVVALALFKILLAPTNDVVAGALSPGAFSRWTDPARLTLVVREMASGLWRWGGWPAVPAIVAVAFVALTPKALNGARTKFRPHLGVFLLAVQLLAFFVVYVMTPHSVAWHLSTSWPRLIAQLWPTMVWTACVARASAGATGVTSRIDRAEPPDLQRRRAVSD